MQEHAITSLVCFISQVTHMQEHNTTTPIRATLRVTCMQEHDTMTPVHATPRAICMQEHDMRATHTRLVKPRSVLGESCQNPRRTLGQFSKGSPLASFTCSHNPRSVLGMPRCNSTGLLKPRTNTSPVQGSLNPRFTLGEHFFC